MTVISDFLCSYLLESVQDLFIRERGQLAIRPLNENIVHFVYVKYRCRLADRIVVGDCLSHFDLSTDCNRIHHSYNLLISHTCSIILQWRFGVKGQINHYGDSPVKKNRDTHRAFF